MIPQRCSGMSPIIVEALLFLKENREFWGIKEVAEALRMVNQDEKTERTKKKMQAHMEEEAIIAEEAGAFGVQQEAVPLNYNLGSV